MELDLQLFGGRGGASGVATAGGSMQDTYGQMAEAKSGQSTPSATEAPKTETPSTSPFEATRNTAQQKRADYAESIRQSSEEQGAYFNSSGDLVHRESDGAKGLREARQRYNQLDYVVNHSNGQGFNSGDLEEFGDFHHRSMTVVTPKTANAPNGHTFTLTQTSATKSESVEKFAAAASKVYTDVYFSTIRGGKGEAAARAMANGLTRQWLKSNAHKYNILYTEQ